MRSRYEAVMDGIALSSISSNLIIRDIAHGVANPAIETASVAKRNGSFPINERQNGASVAITFELHIYSIAERQRVCQEVQRWAKGHILETNDREGQRLNVKCTQYPSISSALRWRDPITMMFTAFEKPRWEEKTPSVVEVTGTSEESPLFVPGNAGKALVEVNIQPNATIENITVSVGNTAIALTDIEATTSDLVAIGYDEKGFLFIKQGNDSLMSHRTGSDDLLAECGVINTVSIESDASATVTFTTRGLWM